MTPLTIILILLVPCIISFTWFLIKIYLPEVQYHNKEDAKHIALFDWCVVGVYEYKDSSTLVVSHGIVEKKLSFLSLHPSVDIVTALKNGTYIRFEFQDKTIIGQSKYDLSSYLLVYKL